MKIDSSGIPYNAPLSIIEKIQLPSGLLPSGEANFYDFLQNEKPYNLGSGINNVYPFPINSIVVSGIKVSGLFSTYPPTVNPVEISGIFNYDGLVGKFSNVSQVSGLKIESFDIFNPYIYHYKVFDEDDNLREIKIPYISTYKVSLSYDPYKR